MKTLVIILSMVLACTITGVGQNYMGANHSKILSHLGEPDIVGDGFISYYDLIEGGVNTYYFDENKNCISFQITRGLDYLADYQKMLKREFTQTSATVFHKKTKKMCYVAELTQLQDNFQIVIQKHDEHLEANNTKVSFN